MDCPVCKNKAKLFNKNFPGYVEGSVFDIFECTYCNTSFISSDQIKESLYDLIYKNTSLPGYERYLGYVSKIKQKDNPLKFLANQELSYRPIYEFLKNKKNLNILDIGCGHGYLTYAMKEMGNNVKGIDISKNAIDSAKSNFGNYYSNCNLKNHQAEKKYNLIVATELIEHLLDPFEFIQDCLNLLTPEGTIILTTPNKDFIKNAVWKTDLPPVHTFWFSKKSFKHLSKTLGINLSFFNFNDYIEKQDNKLAQYFVLKKQTKPFPILDRQGKLYKKRAKDIDSFLKKLIKKTAYSFPGRYISNKIKNSITEEEITLGIFLKKPITKS